MNEIEVQREMDKIKRAIYTTVDCYGKDIIAVLGEDGLKMINQVRDATAKFADLWEKKTEVKGWCH